MINSRHRNLLLATFFVGSVLLYSSVLGLKLGGVIIAFLLFHELGHLLAVKAFGLKQHGIIFVAPLGAGLLAEYPKSRLADGIISLAGPLSGLLLSLITGAAYLLTENAIFTVMTCLVATGNLLNMFPGNSYDGGVIVRSAIRSLPTTTSWFATLLTSAVIIGSAAILSALTGNWFYPLILIVIGLILNRTSRVFTRDQENLEGLALELEVPALKNAIENRLAYKLFKESKIDGASLDDDESLHDLLGLTPNQTKTIAAAEQAVGGKMTFTLYDDMVPMRPTGAWLLLIGYAAATVALAVIGYAALTAPGNIKAVAESMGGLVVLILGK